MWRFSMMTMIIGGSAETEAKAETVRPCLWSPVLIVTIVTPADGEVVIPVSVTGAADKSIVSYEFDLRYDPSVLQPQAEPVDLAGTVSRGLIAVAVTIDQVGTGSLVVHLLLFGAIDGFTRRPKAP